MPVDGHRDPKPFQRGDEVDVGIGHGSGGFSRRSASRSSSSLRMVMVLLSGVVGGCAELGGEGVEQAG